MLQRSDRTEKPAETRRYYTHIDGLRALAISLVMIQHFGGELPKYFSAGYYGVDLFFVISGFLITAILLKSQGGFGTAYKTFMGRRTLRIFPVYYLALAVLFACNFANGARTLFGWAATRGIMRRPQGQERIGCTTSGHFRSRNSSICFGRLLY